MPRNVGKRAPVTALIGLACREAPGGGAQYQGVFDTDGFWGIYKVSDPAAPPRALREAVPADDASEYVAQGDGVNRVRFDCESAAGAAGAAGAATTLALYLNGQKIGDATDDQGLAPGVVVMTVSSPAGLCRPSSTIS